MLFLRYLLVASIATWVMWCMIEMANTWPRYQRAKAIMASTHKLVAVGVADPKMLLHSPMVILLLTATFGVALYVQSRY